MAYYKKINGKNYDKKLLDLAEGFTKSKGDGRLSLEDVQTLLQAVMDADSYTDIEKDTIAYIRKHYKFTDAADKWFRTEIRKWAAKKGKAKQQEPKSKKTTKATEKKKL